MKVMYKVRAHTACINSIIFNSTGTRFVSCGDDGKIKLWNTEKRLVVNTYQAPFGRVNFAVLSPDAKYIYFAGYRRSDTRSTAYDRDFTGLYRVSVSDNTAMTELYDDDDATSYYGTNWGITDGNLDPSGKYIVFTKGYQLLIWDIAAGRLAYKISSPYNLNNVTPRSGAIYAWGDGRILKWTKSTEGYTLSKTIVAGNTSSGYSRIIFSEKGSQFISGDDGSLLNVWNTSSLGKSQVLSGHTASTRAFAFTNNDSLIISGGYDGKIKVWGYPVKETEEEEEKPIVQKRPVAEEPVKTKDTVVAIVEKPKDVVFTENNIPVTVRERPVEKQGTFYVKSQEIEIEIWDNSVYDHDVISLNINGDWILENYEVTKEKKIVKIKVKPNTNNYLILYAINLGEISPNTAAVGLLIDGKVQRLTISSDLQKCGALNFEYRP